MSKSNLGIILSFLFLFIIISILYLYSQSTNTQKTYTMPSELKQWGKIPLLETFDQISMFTSSWVLTEKDFGKTQKDYIIRDDTNAKTATIYRIDKINNKGIFEKGYMYKEIEVGICLKE